MDELYEYAVSCRRYLHQNPEVGFDLSNTVAFVRGELDKMGIVSTDRYGIGSLVAQLGPKDTPLLALRADMDALPVEEKTGLVFASRRPGYMHACGHDAHTAILLTAAKMLKQIEQKLPCRVRLIFQPSEECADSGAKMMVDNGVMEGVAAIICTHCENGLETGAIGVCSGDYMAACAPITIEFFGKTSHATAPQRGVDAIAMAQQSYMQLKEAVAQIAGDRPYIWSVGTFQGGTTHNVIADYCKMDISFRFYDNAFCEQVRQETARICTQIADVFGGSFKLHWHVSTGAVHNDSALTAAFAQILKKNGFSLKSMQRRMSSEDFCWYITKAPGMLFRFGTGTAGKGTTHQNDFTIDEEGMRYAISAFVTFVTECGAYFDADKIRCEPLNNRVL